MLSQKPTVKHGLCSHHRGLTLSGSSGITRISLVSLAHSDNSKPVLVFPEGYAVEFCRFPCNVPEIRDAGDAGQVKAHDSENVCVWDASTSPMWTNIFFSSRSKLWGLEAGVQLSRKVLSVWWK